MFDSKQRSPRSAGAGYRGPPRDTAQPHMRLPDNNKHGVSMACRVEQAGIHSTPPPAHEVGTDRADIDKQGIDFEYIRTICENDAYECEIDISPESFAEHRRSHWPTHHFGPAFEHYANIYEVVNSLMLWEPGWFSQQG